ncbi:uncharacterized protein MONBRDRAFT_5412 [Monosiga brevicollis MX1]|uniref:EamA domain-containing protein n=1 Tax=Monosiga brevicollis TaxID=81824 RepID=A9UQX0_MONBE|nr:uncharacterized protein MONBRDRAFT_5412 [Monosiga brevicollis MX1]EDQ93118.1 predicted protein [Monosiga brevicollis MX1]|eukprot:XP_001742880.1 hypothetical protein [Monosiga brevicollis MX1]
MEPPTWVILLLLVIVQIGFGGYSIVLQAFAKNEHADSLVFSTLRDAFCAPVLMLAAIVTEGGFRVPRVSELAFFGALGLTGMFGNQLGFIEGLYYAGPDVASIFQPLIPVFTAFFAFVVCMERLPSSSRWYQWFKVAGICLGAGGAIVMTLAKSSSADSIDIKQFNSTACNDTAYNVTTWSQKDCHLWSDLDGVVPAYQQIGLALEASCNNSIVTLSFYNDSKCASPMNINMILNDTCSALTDKTTWSCASSSGAKSEILGIIFLIINCSSMAFYVLLQKRYIFDGSGTISRWGKYPVHVTAWSYLFGALCMAIATGIRYAIQQDKSVFVIKTATFGGLAYAVLVSSALCYGLITFCNKYISSLVVTASWPLQVFVTVILSYIVFNIKLQSLEYVGMGLILLGMMAVAYGNFREQQEKRRDGYDMLINDTD